MEQAAELSRLIGRHGSQTYSETAIPGLRIIAATTSPEPLTSIPAPTLTAVVTGRKCKVLGQGMFDQGPGQYLVVPSNLQLTAVIDSDPREPFTALGLTLNPSIVADLLLQTGSDERVLGGSRDATLASMSHELMDALIRLLRLLDDPRDVPVLADTIEREIIWRLMIGPQRAVVRRSASADIRLSKVDKAVRWIRNNYTEAYRAEDVAAMFGMTVSTFHRQFRALMGMSPLTYQKQLRLQQARAQLALRTKNIAGIAFDLGYNSISQFSMEYRRNYGISPSSDAARLSALLKHDENENHQLAYACNTRPI